MDFPFGAIIVLILSIGFFCLLTGWRGMLFLGSIVGGIISLACEESIMFLICLIVCVVSFGLMASRSISTPQGREQMKQYNERERKIEKEYGIIDFTEKDK